MEMITEIVVLHVLCELPESSTLIFYRCSTTTIFLLALGTRSACEDRRYWPPPPLILARPSLPPIGAEQLSPPPHTVGQHGNIIDHLHALLVHNYLCKQTSRSGEPQISMFSIFLIYRINLTKLPT